MEIFCDKELYPLPDAPNDGHIMRFCKLNNKNIFEPNDIILNSDNELRKWFRDSKNLTDMQAFYGLYNNKKDHCLQLPLSTEISNKNTVILSDTKVESNQLNKLSKLLDSKLETKSTHHLLLNKSDEETEKETEKETEDEDTEDKKETESETKHHDSDTDSEMKHHNSETESETKHKQIEKFSGDFCNSMCDYLETRLNITNIILIFLIVFLIYIIYKLK